jgi:hypothetical protein
VRTQEIEAQFVEFVPDTLDPGVLYISIRYGAVVHACCCGCGEKVSTPLSPAQWSLTYDGERISLHPSVGSGALPCRSHYFITRNAVQWARPLTARQTSSALERDRDDVAGLHHDPSTTRVTVPRHRSRGRMWRWFGRR